MDEVSGLEGEKMKEKSAAEVVEDIFSCEWGPNHVDHVIDATVKALHTARIEGRKEQRIIDSNTALKTLCNQEESALGVRISEAIENSEIA